ncbi:MAG: hypothetical protein GX601_13330 [Anaerolineales bacterium]|nr:hypothetical protein [Anaerolineales bacterium]
MRMAAQWVTGWLRRRRVGRDIRALAAWRRLAGGHFSHPRVIALPPGQRVLVLSPHPDDETIGVGGTLLKHHQAGCQVTVAVLTDGAAGALGRQRIEVTSRRQAEARAAAQVLGVDRLIFEDVPDAGLADMDPARLRALLEETAPDLVYLPFFLDNHPDHRALTPLLARALRGASLDFACCAYETWSPVAPNILVDISETLAGKQEALACYRSQLETRDYTRMVAAMAVYRGALAPVQKLAAEAFAMGSVRQYLALAEQCR